jgi:transposase-like protein
MLDGTVEIDETYVGGKFRKGMPRREKDVVIGIRQRGGQLRLIHAEDAKAKTVREIIGGNISEDVEVIVTDESTIYPFALNKDQQTKHKTIQHKTEYVSGLVHTNTAESAFSLLKRGIMGTWHNVSAKHLQAYLDEMVFRFNRRYNSDLFLDTLRHMVTAPVLTFKKLTKETEAA